jgi:protocatechuate 3,4-dioxygenase beta subunit
MPLIEWRTIMKKHFPVSLLFVFLLSLTPAFAQDGGTIKGSVTDPNGAAVAGAKVTASPSPAGQTREAVTDAQGQYALGNLAPGKVASRLKGDSFR